MNVKAFATLTEHYADARRLPVDPRAEPSPDELQDDPRLYPKDLGPEMVAELARRFRASIEPLRAGGRLGLVLLQYPVWFTASRDNERKLQHVSELVLGCRACDRTFATPSG